MYLKLVSKYGEEETRRRIGLARKDAEFRRLMKSVTKNLPADVQKKIAEKADKIRNVEDLAAVVNGIYAQHGATLDASYLMFSFGGKMQLMVKLNDAGYRSIKELFERCRDEQRDVNEEVVRRFGV